MAIEEHFNCSACYCALDISNAEAAYRDGKFSDPEFIFVDWSVMRSDPAGNIARLKTLFPTAERRIVVLSGEVPLVDTEKLGIFSILKKQSSISRYGELISGILMPDLTVAKTG